MAGTTNAGAPPSTFVPRKGFPILFLRSLPLYGKECLALLQEIVADGNTTRGGGGTRTTRTAVTGATARRGHGAAAEAAAAAAAAATTSAAAAGLGGSISPVENGGSSRKEEHGWLRRQNDNGHEAEASGMPSRGGPRPLGDDDGPVGGSNSGNESSDIDDDEESQSGSSDDSDSSGSEAAADEAAADEESEASEGGGHAVDEATARVADADHGVVVAGLLAAAAAAPPGAAASSVVTNAARRGMISKGKKRERRLKTESEYKRHVESIPCHQFSVAAVPRTAATKTENDDTEDVNNSDVVLCVPNCLSPDRNTKDDISNLLSRRLDADTNHSSNSPALREAKALVSLLEQAQSQNGLVVVIWWMRSGRFAGAVFVNDTCVAHSTKARYTTRKGQGKSQSAMDNQKGRSIKSVGAQLRRAGQVQLWDDVRSVAVAWTSYLQKAHLVFVMVPTVMHGTLWKETFTNVLTKDDGRVRTRVPLNLKKPGFDSVVMVHRVLTTCTLRPYISHVVASAEESGAEKSGVSVQSPKIHQQETAKAQEVVWPPWTPLHEAAAKGGVEALVALLGQHDVNVNAVAGPLLQTPLHVAAAAGSASAAVAVEGDGQGDRSGEDEHAVNEALKALSTDDASEIKNEGSAADAAECVYQLLVTGGADPTVTDIRNRVPYFLASSEPVRVAFRRARAVLESGESALAWDWDAAKVGPALTDEELDARKEKEAEKKRQKKQRQKERKTKDKAAAEAMERQRQQQAEEQLKQDEAKRIRDGLQPKAGTTKASNVCDYCQKVCVGKRRRDMYQRLEYAYCSTECVQKHKRELMAAAAMARFQSS
jgi:Bacteroidetes VLRF1 release factor/Vms1-associating treble clef domain